jgi:hypothetical protein
MSSTIRSAIVCWMILAAQVSARADDRSPRQRGPSTAATQAWVDDFPAFANSAGGKRWIVARSSSPCLSENEAFEAASRDARDQLYSRVRTRLASSCGPETEAWMKRRLSQELSTSRDLIVDRYVSRVHRPYGDIWSESILVDASSGRLSALVREHAQWYKARQQSRRGTAASIGGLSLAILLVYAVLNAVTKGYFRGRLRAGAAVTLALLALGVIYTLNGAG